jgi:hypothetical protein
MKQNKNTKYKNGELNKMAKDDKLVAIKPFGYNGVYRDRGEVFKSIEGKNDAALLGRRYMVPFDPKTQQELSCEKCGRWFSSIPSLQNHKRKKFCADDSQQFTKQETAEVMNIDVANLEIVDREPRQVATDLTNQIAGR